MAKRKLIHDKKKFFKFVVCFVLLVGVAAMYLVFFTDLLPVNDNAEAASVRQGSTGTVVKNIQTKLKQWGYYTGSVDGIYGAKTAAAVKSFQRTNGLSVDGVVGTQTANALGITLSSGGNSGNTNSSYLLARCVYAEARGEPYVGQVAVAAVILNRVKSSSFPNTVSGVIYQPYAFTCVSDGQINLAPDSTAIKAANDALNGWDPTYGCLYYYNPATATSAWIWSKKVHLTIGRHSFCL